MGVLRTLTRLVRPGGIVAFQEQSWTPFVHLSAHVPLWSAGVNLLHEISRRAGVNMEMGVALHRAFQEAGLPIPKKRLAMELGHDPDFTSWVSDVISTLAPQAAEMGISLSRLGPLDTLAERLQAEVAESNTVVPWLALVGAWCRLPAR